MEGVVIGNFAGQPGGAFPVDAGTFESMQNNILSLMAMAAIGGVNYIVAGCELNNLSTSRGAGWLYLRTRKHPAGELVYFVGGAVADGFYLSEESEQVVANGVTYNAYTARCVKPGNGAEHWSWSAIRAIKTNYALGAMIEVVRNEANPIGTIRMFAGTSANIPEGWLVCDGRDYDSGEYPDLYGIIGDLYSGGATVSGRFRVPDLAERFAKHGDTPGVEGGTSTFLLRAEYLPPHAHEVEDYYFTNKEEIYPQLQNMKKISDTPTIGSATSTPGDAGTFGAYYKHLTEIAISDGQEVMQQAAMPISPAYVTVTYIIRAK